MTSLSHLSVEELADGICLRAGRIAAAEAELLTWIGEFDERSGWAGHGLLSCAHWLSWKTSLSPGAARERVRVARTLRQLPVVAEAFGQGLMSWSQVRALTRVARPDDGIDWAMIARSTSGAQIEKIVRGMRRAKSLEEAKEDCERAAWLVRTRKTYDADGNLVMTIYAKAEVAPVVAAAFDTKRAELEREAEAARDVPAGTSEEADATGEGGQGVPAGTPRHCCELHRRRTQWQSGGDVPAGTSVGDETAVPRITDGDALLAMAQDVLCEATPTADTARRNRFRMTANVDPLSGWGRLRDGELLPPTSLQTVMKTLPGRDGTVRLRPVGPADLRRFDLGRSHRDVSANLRELVGTIDGERCRFPGCTRHKKLHAHHVVYWSEGGTTDFDNLVLVCSRHHTLVHSQ
ncbi:MAG: hypothetical protein QOE84_2013, partial [Actinomycetota bacterium]|nr:hypothetical protein [Actinomycetota bacterium]